MIKRASRCEREEKQREKEIRQVHLACDIQADSAKQLQAAVALPMTDVESETSPSVPINTPLLRPILADNEAQDRSSLNFDNIASRVERFVVTQSGPG